MRELVIDVSHWDDGIDLAAWKSLRGCWGVIVKAGGNEGGRYRDQSFGRSYDEARAAGLNVGSYYYTVATDAEAAREDARHCLSILGDRSFDLPIYIDVEDAGQATIGRRRLTDVCLAFIREIEAAGHRGGVYTSGSWWQSNVYADELRPYACWIAWWTSDKPSAISDVGMWQFGSMRLSDGDVRHDDVSGHVDANYCYVDYPSDRSGGERVMAGLTYPNAAAEVMEHVIEHGAHGYSQANRAGDGTVEQLALSDGTAVRIHGGDYDCSELVRMCYAAVGVLPWDYWESYMWTGNERDVLTGHGFVEVPLTGLQRGDVLWRQGHTELYLGDGLQGGARRSETHGTTGRVGDQDGYEIAKSAFVASEWTTAYRCTLVRVGTKSKKGTAQTEDEMIFLARLDEENGLVYCDGSTIHDLAHEDEASAIREVYRRTHDGAEIPEFDYGTKKAPWGWRLRNAMARKQIDQAVWTQVEKMARKAVAAELDARAKS